MNKALTLASYQFFPYGTQEKILLEDATPGVCFDFQDAAADDKLYLQLFDQGFQHPPSKLYRNDAEMTGDIVQVTCRFEVEQPCVVQVFKMQYGQKKRMVSETEQLTLTDETTAQFELERVHGAAYFKIAWKFLNEGNFRVYLRELTVVQHVRAKEEITYAI